LSGQYGERGGGGGRRAPLQARGVRTFTAKRSKASAAHEAPGDGERHTKWRRLPGVVRVQGRALGRCAIVYIFFTRNVNHINDV
jgi:hypothetical protein